MPRNNLDKSTSLYLKQHQHNPVHWQPWEEQPWEAAKAQNKLVIVSVGYSACHWCHVMERETFEDGEAAAFMNAHFVSIKVDREERPDVDQAYMQAVQLMTQRGGWPLNCVALPDGRPIWGGMYFPKERWLTGLKAVLEVWQEDPGKVEAYAAHLASAVEAMADGALSDQTDTNNLDDEKTDAALLAGLDAWSAKWDPVYGGVQGAPKFPLPCQIDFLLQTQWGPSWLAKWKSQASNHGRLTLERMEQGGLHDHVGGGFSRYSVDHRWHVPHFEKMLCDNAQLLELFAESWSQQPRAEFRQAAEKTYAFLMRELDDPSGGFKSAMDADSDGEEGAYYVWTMEDLARALPDKHQLNAVVTHFDVDGKSLWQAGQNVLMRSTTGVNGQLDAHENQRLHEALQQMQSWRDQARAGKSKPLVDDKVLTAWTALTVKALARAGRALDERKWVDRALKGAHFLCHAARMTDHPERLRRTWHPDGGPTHEGFAEDYAFTIQALLEAHQATLNPSWREEARALMATALDRFFDDRSRTFSFAASEAKALFANGSNSDDSVLPSANATLAQNLWRLGWSYDIPSWRELALELTRNHLNSSNSLERSAAWAKLWLDMRKPYAVVVITAPSREEVKAELSGWWSSPKPGTWIDAVWEASTNIPPWMEDKRPAPGDPVRWYVCVQGACLLPVETADAAWNQLQSFSR